MVTAKTVLGLFAATAIAAGGAAWLLQDQAAGPGNGAGADLPDRLFPDLESRLNDVTRLTVTHDGETLTLARTGDGDTARWTIAEKDGYPASIETVRETLITAARLAPVEAKTRNPDLFGRLGLQPVTAGESAAGDSAARLVTIGIGDETVAAVLVGKAGPPLSDTRKTVYVRQPDADQTWMVEGDLRPAVSGLDWLDRTITNVRKERLRQVLIYQPDGTVLTIGRDDPDDSLFALRTLPAGRELKSPSEVSQVTFGLEYLDLDDVVARPGDARDRLAARFTTYGGLQVDVRLVERDGKTWTAYEARTVAPDAAVVAAKREEYQKLDAGAAEDAAATATGADRVKDAAAVQAEADLINSRTRGWLYAVSDYKVQRFTKTLAGMLKPLDAPADPVAPAADSGTN